MIQESHLALRTQGIVGREEELQAIRQAILARQTYVLVFKGPGGIGKTRLLEEVGNPEGIFAAEDLEFTWSGIIDLYHPETHSRSGIEEAVIEGIGRTAPQLIECFEEYREQRKELEWMRQEMVGAGRIEKMRAQLTKTFLQDYNKAATQSRLVLAFDTAELIQFESDIIQQICQLDEESIVIKTWLTDFIPHAQNTVVLLAGRPDPTRLWNDLRATFKALKQKGKIAFQEFDLGRFEPFESSIYFDQLAATARADGRERDAKTVEKLSSKVRQVIHECADGRPIRLGLAIDLAVHGKDIKDLFPPSAEDGAMPEVTWEQIEPRLINELSEVHISHPKVRIGYPIGHILRYLAVTHLGLDETLLHHLVPDWPEEDCRSWLQQTRAFSFVKVRPGSENVLFLHDEMYELLERHWVLPEQGVSWDSSGFAKLYREIADYYEKQLPGVEDDENREQDLHLKILHYRLRVEPRRCYEENYTRWSEFAIKGHQTGFDMRLRDEALRFYNVPANQELSRLQGLTREAIDRDSAVRWVKRYSARAQYQKAIEVAETILAFGPEPYCSLIKEPPEKASAIKGHLRGEASRLFGIDDQFFWAHLLTYYGEAMLFLGAPELQARRALDKAISLLETVEVKEKSQQWWYARILGRAHNLLGYAHRIASRYKLSNECYHTALHHYRNLDIRDEMADTLTNAAYVYALLGDISIAEKWIDDALELRRELGQGYPLALTLNTRGLIHLKADEPHRALPRCQEASDICRQLEDRRGEGMASNALGLVYRKLGNLNRSGVYNFDQALDFYEQAEEALNQSISIFSVEVPERSRLVEACNEMGAVYRDWAILLKRAEQEAEAAKRFELAQENFERAIGEAGDDWPVDGADSYEDIADIFIIQGRMDKAEEYLSKAEALVPPEYRLVEGQGFKDIDEPVEGFWQMMGKICLARGDIVCAPVHGLEHLSNEQEFVLLEGVEQYALAIAYFLKYSSNLVLHKEAFDAFYGRLKKRRIERLKKARERVLAVSGRFKVNLDPLVAEIDEALGLKAPTIQ